MTKSKLKPCPFCGNEDLRTAFNNNEYQFIECEPCGLCLERVSKDEIIKAWNMRVESEVKK